MRKTGYLFIFRRRDFSAFWVALLGFRLADNFFTVGLFWWILEATNSEALLSLVAALTFLPMFIFGLFSGALIDLFDRRKILAISALARAFLVPLIPLLYYLQILEIWHIYVVAFLQGVSSTFFIVAASAIIPQLVPKDDLMAANSLVDISSWFGNIVGFLAGGFLVGLLGAMKILVLPSVFLFVSSLLIVLIHVEAARFGSSRVSHGIVGDLVDGFRIIKNDVVVLVFIVTWAGIQMLFAGGPMSVGLPVFSAKVLNVGADGYGLLVAALSVSSLAGSVVVGGLGTRRKKGHLILLGFVWGAVGMFMFSLITNFVAALIIIALWNLCFPLINIPFTTALQERASESDLGKVFGFANMLASAMTPLSLVMTGFIMENTSVIIPFQLFAASLGVCFIIVYATKTARNTE